MPKYSVNPVDVESELGQEEVIVSKTDLTGRIIYANEVFCRVAEMDTTEVIGEPHSLIRHPDMPRSVFKLLWDQIQTGKEIFAFVKNMSKTGKYYWVFAHVTPSFNAQGDIVGYHSNRRKPSAAAVSQIEGLYSKLLAAESRHENKKVGLEAGENLLKETLGSLGVTYDEFIWSVGEGK